MQGFPKGIIPFGGVLRGKAPKQGAGTASLRAYFAFTRATSAFRISSFACISAMRVPWEFW